MTRQRRGGGFFTTLLVVALFGVALLAAAGLVIVLLAPDLLADTPLARQRELPPTVAAAAVLPTLTYTPTPDDSLLPTWTPASPRPTAPLAPTNTRRPTLTPSATPILPTRTPIPTATNTPTDTPTASPTGPTPTVSPTRSAFPFTKTDNSPFYLRNYANNAGCDWLGVAGEVLDLERNPVPAGSYQVHVWGDGIDDKYLSVGSAPAYSPSGWEQFLFNAPAVRNYNVQLETPNGTAVSQVYSVQTRASCDENLVRIDFVQNH